MPEHIKRQLNRKRSNFRRVTACQNAENTFTKLVLNIIRWFTKTGLRGYGLVQGLYKTFPARADYCIFQMLKRRNKVPYVLEFPSPNYDWMRASKGLVSGQTDP